MKLTFGGKWEIELTPTTVSPELEEEIKKAMRATIKIDQQVEDIVYGNDTRASDGSTHKSKRSVG
jgi:hypothetical protein